ncbi:MAG: LON peptidase substrate-binding domain-containing protein [Thermodesulfobacteriota bacterium]
MLNTEIDFREITNLDNFSGIIPIFPLSTVVFFPNTLLPLHIFEPRYREMLRDAENSEKLLGMTLLRPGWEKDYFGNPDVFNITGIGRIISSETFEDGKSNVVLYGLKRAKIVEIFNDKSYRTARIELLENISEKSSEVLKEKILYMISTWNDMLDERHENYKIKVNAELSLGKLTDILASVLISNVFEKQKFLEELNIDKRAEMIFSFLEARSKMLAVTSARQSEIVNKRNLN